MRITLTVNEGPHQGQAFSFEEHDNFIVGRSNQAHFQLPDKDKYFSRIHFLVEVNPPACRLMDLGSRNGTYVNGQRVTSADLKDGDQIKAGRTVLHVSVQGAETPPPPPTARPSSQPPAEAYPYSTLKPFAVPELPPPLPQPVLAPKSCLVCSGPLPNAKAPPDAVDRLLCLACREQAHSQAQTVPGFLIVRELGRGGMGVVYLAVRKSDGLLLALKTVIPAVAGTQQDIDRFLREANILRQLDHPHIVAFREVGQGEGQLYFAMDYVRGSDAARLLKEQGALPIGRAVALACQLLEALEYAHARGFVHRDIKPGNMLVTNEDGREVAKLMDFGLARTYQASRLSGLTLQGHVGGTPAFLPPEQITHFRDVKPAADQFAAAATLYNLLTKRYIYDLPSTLQQQILMMLQEPPVPIQKRRPDVPAGVAEAIHRALARAPEERFADVKAMRLALLAASR
jgi:serine/threonine-protein kinase